MERSTRVGLSAADEKHGEMHRPFYSRLTLKWMLLILLVAAVLRIWGILHVSPPGIEHDEVANWLIDRSILEGNHAIYFTAAYGHEAGFHYVQAVFLALLGDNPLALRLPAVFAGVMLVAVGFALARRLFGPSVALYSAALLAALFWPIFYSRLGLRAISLPLVSGISAYFWCKASGIGGRGPEDPNPGPSNQTTGSRLNFALAGLFAGLSMHTYMAARAIPIFYSAWLLYLALFHRGKLRHLWRGIGLFWAVFVAIAAPLFFYLQLNPGSEYRISEIDGPLRALLSGNIGPVLENGFRVLGMFGLSGDPLWRQNVAGLPVFDPLVAVMFYVSVLLCLLRFKDIRYAFLLLWLLISAVPSLVTIDAPSTIRIINSLPVLTIFPSLVIHNPTQLSTVMSQLSTKVRLPRRQLWLSILILYYIGLTGWFVFRVWPRNSEVQFVWQAAFNEAADFLDAETEDGPVAIGGWTPDTMDRPTVELSLRRDDLKLSFFDPTSSLLIPANPDGETVRIIHPTILELNSLFVERLMGWGASVRTVHSFTLYSLGSVPVAEPQHPANVIFGDQLHFLGYDMLDDSPASLELISYWQVSGPIHGPLRLFIHVVDGDGELLAEAYALDRADSRSQVHWQPGDTILQHHRLDPAETASSATQTTTMRLGVFDPNSCPPEPCRNLLTRNGEAYVSYRLGS